MAQKDGARTASVKHLLHHEKKLLNNLRSQWHAGNFCDLKIVAIDGCISVHASVAAAFSPKIANTLSKLWQDRSKNISIISSLASSSLEPFVIKVPYGLLELKIVMSALYTGEFNPPASLLSKIHAAVEWLQVKELLDTFEGSVDKTLSNFQEEKKAASADKQLSLCHSDINPRKRRKVTPTSLLHKPLKPLSPAKKESNDSKSSQSDIQTSSEQVKASDDGLESSIENTTMVTPVHSSPQKRVNLEKNRKLVSLLTAPPKCKNLIEINKMQDACMVNPSLVNDTAQVEVLPAPEPQRNGDVTVATTEQVIETEGFIAAELTAEEGNNLWNFVGLDNSGLPIVDVTTGPQIVVKLEPEQEQEVIVKDEPKDDLVVDEYLSLDFACHICPRRFSLKHTLTRHIQQVHYRNAHLVCRHCGIQTETERQLRKHSISMHNDRLLFPCPEPGCKTVLSTNCSLINHRSTHGTHNFVCDRCGHACHNITSLHKHQKTCYNTQEHLCDICGQMFNIRTSMVAHRKVMHFGQRNWVCKVCSKAFDYRANLQRHMRLHTNSYPYPCTECDQRFRHSNTLLDHLKRKHKDRFTASEISSSVSMEGHGNYQNHIRERSCKPRSKRQTKEERLQAQENGSRLSKMNASQNNSATETDQLNEQNDSQVLELFIRC
ncbi:Zinc finger protein 184-like [Plakobranchus ocellatus]|uniref:Zinc finger protein 184-like n=1 Tax=Plakobranchus ocellatus TaxID=259542 RepID=A0AAV4CPF9_9GAST|nr:Zinc finger protein 184-like [Plakobranchus ocellatus]